MRSTVGRDSPPWVGKLLLVTPLAKTIPIKDGIEAMALLPYDDQEFWRSGSSCAAIRYQVSVETYHKLALMCRPGTGYYISHSTFREEKLVPDTTFVALTRLEFRDKVSLDVGGDFFNFPASAFLPPQTAEAVVVDFCADGSLSKYSIWCKHPLPLEFDEVYGAPY
jgi:hypothetical protein